MEYNTGYIKIYRQIVDWEWYTDTNTKTVFLHLLLTANYQDKQWRGIVIKRGERVCSYSTLSEELHLSVMNIRTAISHLKSTGEITSKPHAKYSVISIKNYDLFQTVDKQVNKQPTSNQQATNKQLTTTKERKEIKKDNKDNILAQNDAHFCSFWNAYPKKVSKQNAKKAFEKIKCDDELIGVILSSLAQWKKTTQWKKDNGQFIPYPATWLNGKLWESEFGNVCESNLSVLDFYK